MSEIDERLGTILKHHGVKGMHWGVRHDEHRNLNPKDPSTKEPGKIKKNLDSLKRERQWKSVLREMDNLSTKDINTVKRRVDLENSLKKLSKSKVANSNEKQAYLNRHDMSNDELVRKINRIQAKDNLQKSISSASKEQREVGIRVIQTVGSLTAKAAMGNKLNPKDFLDAVQNPHIKNKQSAWDEGVKVADKYNKNEKVKKALNVAKDVKFKSKS